MSKSRIHSVVCPFCLMDVLAPTAPQPCEMADIGQLREYITRQLEDSGHLIWHAEQMSRVSA